MGYDSQRAHFYRLCKHEKQLYLQGYFKIAGIDEVGRGPLAGPVVACACILPKKGFFRGLNDSKQVAVEKREILFQELTSHPEVRYGIGCCDVETINQINIFQASLLAMEKALANLPEPPDYLLVDGKHLPTTAIPGKAIVGGDAKSASIAAASILAKVTRDAMMVQLHAKWPQYGFAKHKGYGTPEHWQAVEKWGPCPLHRVAFLRRCF